MGCGDIVNQADENICAGKQAEAMWGDRSRAVVIGGILGGAIGAMAVSGSGHMVSADAFPALKVSPDATAIDMETGAFIF